MLFKDIVGCKSTVAELKQVCDSLIHADKYQKFGIKPCKGVIIGGGKRRGKTTFAQALADEIGYETFYISPKDEFVNFAKRLTDLVELLKTCKQAIVIIDDANYGGPSDECTREATERNRQAITKAVATMENLGAFIILTYDSTKDTDSVDSLYFLYDVEHFDRIVKIERPTIVDSEEFITRYLKGKENYIRNVDVKALTSLLHCSVRRKLDAIMIEAGTYAAYHNKDWIEMDDIVYGILRAFYDIPLDYSPESSPMFEQISYHEASHVVISELLDPGSVALASILGDTRDIGGITKMAATDHHVLEYRELERSVLCSLASRAVSEVIYDMVDMGITDDIRCAYGQMNEFIGEVCETGFGTYNGKGYSTAYYDNKRGHKIEQELNTYYEIDKQLLSDNRDFLEAIAQALREKHTILQKDIQAIKAKFISNTMVYEKGKFLPSKVFYQQKTELD